MLCRLQEAKGDTDADFAKSLFQLEMLELLWDGASDMKALVGLNRQGTVVIAFRCARSFSQLLGGHAARLRVV